MDELAKHRATEGGSTPPDPGARRRIGDLLLVAGGLPVLILGLLVIVALMPGARAIDARADRQQPMYTDIQRFHTIVSEAGAGAGDLQSQTIQGTGTEINGESFRPSDGVTLQVRVEGTEYCVKASNEYGDTTSWDCVPPAET